MFPRYPLMLDVSDRQIVIVGGGAVAARKAVGVAAAGATKIRVIAAEFKAIFDPGIDRRTKLYDGTDLRDAGLVFAATDSVAVNDQVVSDAHADRILVCRADENDDLPGDFTTPAMFQSGAITIAVSAGSAAFAVVVRDSLQQSFDPQWAAMADAMLILRPLIKSLIQTSSARARLFRELATPRAFQILRTDGFDALKNWILSPSPRTF